jgi:abequosyltransferase
VNTKLAISIPTFNRSGILKDNLPQIIIEAKKYSIPIFISDNSLDNHTKELVSKLRQNYDFIFYKKDLINIGHDRNSLEALQMPKTDYVWLLGDSFEVQEKALNKVISVINQYSPNIISMNALGRELNIKSGIYDYMDAFYQLGWHLTLTGVTVYSREAITSLNYSKILQSKNFPQIPLIFDYLEKNNSLYWVNDKLISASSKRNGKGYWVKNTFSIFIDDWSRAIHGLSEQYDYDKKQYVILKHSRKTNLFGLKSMIALRLKNVFTYHILSNYKTKLISHSKLNYPTMLLISILPVSILRLVRKFFFIFIQMISFK